MISSKMPGPALIDLHTHTDSSDSPVSPETLFAQAQRLGLTCLSVTDHDTTAALPHCVGLAERLGLGFIPGIEITSVTARGDVAHILGYGIQLDCVSKLNAALEGVREARTAASRRSVEVLREMGYDITWEQVMVHATGTGVFKLHIMHALVDAGYATRLKGQLYKELCSPAGPMSGHQATVPADVAIDFIHQCGGIAILAHPGLHNGLNACENLLQLGLDGIEAFHPSHTLHVEMEALSLAERYGLAVTGGTDYHGTDGDHDAPLGRVGITADRMEELLERISARSRRAWSDASFSARPLAGSVQTAES